MNELDFKNKRIIFMGTPKIASIILEGLIDANYNICLVVTNKDAYKGRKNVLTPSEVKQVALKHNIEVFQPESIKKDYQRIVDVDADLIVTCAYGQIVPKGVLDAVKIGSINVHGSLLPSLRGASPIQSALFLGLKKTGVTIMEMVEKMDAGRMYAKKEVEILEDDNYTSLYDKIALAGKELLLEILPSYINKTINFEEQEEKMATFCKKILSEDEHLSLYDDIDTFVNKVRGLSLTPGGYLLLNDKKFKILKCEKYSLEHRVEVGRLIKENKKTLLLQIQGGLVKLNMVQKESKNVMDACSFLNGERDLNSLILK